MALAVHLKPQKNPLVLITVFFHVFSKMKQKPKRNKRNDKVDRQSSAGFTALFAAAERGVLNNFPHHQFSEIVVRVFNRGCVLLIFFL